MGENINLLSTSDEYHHIKFDMDHFYFFQDRCAYFLMKHENATFYDVLFYKDPFQTGYIENSFPKALKQNLRMILPVKRIFNEFVGMKKRQYEAIILQDEQKFKINSRLEQNSLNDN